MCQVRENEALLYVEPCQKTAGLCRVQVTSPPRHSGSGFWPGLEPNQTEPLVETWTAGRLPGPLAGYPDPFLTLVLAAPEYNQLKGIIS